MEQINIIDVVDYLDRVIPHKKYADQSSQDHDYEEKQLHYVNTSIGFMKGANRFEIGYGKKKSRNILCGRSL